MVTNEAKAEMCVVLRKHLTKAVNEIADKEIVRVNWPDGHAERLAEQVAQTICFAAESAAGEYF